jgi:dehydrogenase/reductase SDR family member 7B
MIGLRFANKQVWITGASSGIGEQLAIAFGKRKAHLILSGRNVESLNRVAALCIEAASVTIVPLDLAEYTGFDSLVAKQLHRVGNIDVLINNAGISQRGAVLDTSMAVVEQLMKVNFLGTVALTRAILPSMVRHQIGQIVVVSSVVGKFATPRRSSYSASKHALHGYFDALRAEMHAENVQVSIFCPGYVRTNISINALNEKGEPQGTMDETTANGLHPADVAERMVGAIDLRVPEMIIGGFRERLGVLLSRFWPARLRKMLLTAKVT